LHLISTSDISLRNAHFSAPSCDHFGRHGKWKKYLATKSLAKVANWRPTDYLLCKRETHLKNYQK